MSPLSHCLSLSICFRCFHLRISTLAFSKQAWFFYISTCIHRNLLKRGGNKSTKFSANKFHKKTNTVTIYNHQQKHHPILHFTTHFEKGATVATPHRPGYGIHFGGFLTSPPQATFRLYSAFGKHVPILVSEKKTNNSGNHNFYMVKMGVLKKR